MKDAPLARMRQAWSTNLSPQLDASYLSYTHSAYIHTYIASRLDASYLSYTHSAYHVVADHVHTQILINLILIMQQVKLRWHTLFLSVIKKIMSLLIS